MRACEISPLESKRSGIQMVDQSFMPSIFRASARLQKLMRPGSGRSVAQAAGSSQQLKWAEA